jgi:hypothetical protein
LVSWLVFCHFGEVLSPVFVLTVATSRYHSDTEKAKQTAQTFANACIANSVGSIMPGTHGKGSFRSCCCHGKLLVFWAVEFCFRLPSCQDRLGTAQVLRTVENARKVPHNAPTIHEMPSAWHRENDLGLCLDLATVFLDYDLISVSAGGAITRTSSASTAAFAPLCSNTSSCWLIFLLRVSSTSSDPSTFPFLFCNGSPAQK